MCVCVCLQGYLNPLLSHTPFLPQTQNPKTHHSGTSSADGFGIAWAVAARLAGGHDARCRTLFATHFHELTELERWVGCCFGWSGLC